MTLGDRLRELREKLNISQIIASKKIGISNKVLSNYENSITSPDIETIILLCQFYNISSDYLLGIDIENIYNKPLPTDDEYRVLSYYNRLNDDYKDSAKGHLVDLYREQQNISSEKPKKSIS